MIGSWRWNAAFGGFGAALTLLLSLANNPLLTSLVRALYALIAFGVLAFAVRYVLGLMLLPAPVPESEELSEEERGSVLDLVTPDEEQSLAEMMKENWSDGKDSPDTGFQPLQPKRVVSLDNPDPEDVVHAIRRLNDE